LSEHMDIDELALENAELLEAALHKLNGFPGAPSHFAYILGETKRMTIETENMLRVERGKTKGIPQHLVERCSGLNQEGGYSPGAAIKDVTGVLDILKNVLGKLNGFRYYEVPRGLGGSIVTLGAGRGYVDSTLTCKDLMIDHHFGHINERLKYLILQTEAVTKAERDKRSGIAKRLVEKFNKKRPSGFSYLPK